MDIREILNDKFINPKDKTEFISKMILSGEIMISALVEFAKSSKDPAKATCIEALEFATKTNPGIADSACLEFVTGTLKDKAPRIKWESARVIGNIAHRFPGNLDKAISSLLANTEHSGTVVRWSAAFALTEIIKLKTKYNTSLLPAIDAILEREEKNSIKKIYLTALKKVRST